MKIIQIGPWIYYTDTISHLDDNKCGKWMHFFNNLEFISEVCKTAVEEGVVTIAKHSDHNTGVACFYINYDDMEAHKRVLTYFIEKKLIRKTKTGKYFDISFKLDNQSRNNEYGEQYESEIKLSKFIDLETGMWIIE